MHESLAEQLSRFTPDGSGLDRDALLFAAGQASVPRPTRTWGVLVGALAACQLLTLVLLWPESKGPLGPVAQGPVAVTTPTGAVSVDADNPTTLANLTSRTIQSPSGDLPAATTVDHLADATPPLRAFAPSSFIGLD
jgi:hypothetical protein